MSFVLTARRRLTISTASRETAEVLRRAGEYYQLQLNLSRGDDVHRGKQTDAFQQQTGVRLGRLLSPCLFLQTVDWIFKQSTTQRTDCIQWMLLHSLTTWTLKMIWSYFFPYPPTKTGENYSTVALRSACLGLSYHEKKNNVPRINTVVTTTLILPRNEV